MSLYLEGPGTKQNLYTGVLGKLGRGKPGRSGKPGRLFGEKLKIFFAEKTLIFLIFENQTKHWFIKIVSDETRT